MPSRSRHPNSPATPPPPAPSVAFDPETLAAMRRAAQGRVHPEGKAEAEGLRAAFHKEPDSLWPWLLRCRDDRALLLGDVGRSWYPTPPYTHRDEFLGVVNGKNDDGSVVLYGPRGTQILRGWSRGGGLSSVAVGSALSLWEPRDGERGRRSYEGNRAVPGWGMALAFGGDPVGIDSAEHAVRISVRAVLPWSRMTLVLGKDTRRTVVWRDWHHNVLLGPEWLTAPYDEAMSALRDALQRLADSREVWSAINSEVHAMLGSPPGGHRSSVKHEIFWGALAWSMAVDRGLVVRHGASPAAVAGRTFEELEDPFEPLLDVYALGYGFGGLWEPSVILLAQEL